MPRVWSKLERPGGPGPSEMGFADRDRRHAPCPAGSRQHASAVTLVELLCVLAIISILMSMLLPTAARAYNKAKGISEEIEVSEIARLLVRNGRGYCQANPNYFFSSKSEFADKCRLAPKCRDWVSARTTEFAPFTYLDSTNKIVLTFHYGRNHANLWAFSKGELSTTPPPR